MEIFIIWFALSLVAGAIAGNKGRSSFGFFFLSLLLTPLIGILAALAAQRNVEHTEREAIDSGTMRRCPYCAELVRCEAVKCKHCGSALEAVAHDTPAHRAGRAVARMFKPPQ